jgi:hypothetical protein
MIICRDIDWGAMFLGFLDPYSSGKLPNLLNPLGRGFHLPEGCAPARQPGSITDAGCFAPLGDTLMLALHAWQGEVGSNLLAVDTEFRRIAWPDRVSRIDGIGELRTIATLGPGTYFGINNAYKIAGKSGDFVLYSSPSRFRTSSRVIEVAGDVGFHEWQPDGEGYISETPVLKAPVVWQFERW